MISTAELTPSGSRPEATFLSCSKEKKQKKYTGRGSAPYINQGKGDTSAQKSCESPPPQSCSKHR
eukprot:1149719-Pelagomonas_calceolata.AAC.2